MPGLVVQHGLARSAGKGNGTVCLAHGRLGLLFGVAGPLDLQPERREPEVVGGGHGERDRGDRRDVAADSLARRVTRGSRSLSRPSERNVGLESSPVPPEVSWISSVVASRRVQRAANVLSSTRSRAGAAPG